MDWENIAQLNCDANEFDASIQEDSPVKTRYERDSDYEPENECLSPPIFFGEKSPHLKTYFYVVQY